MKLTAQLLHEQATDNHGWNRAQLETIGVQWPPRSGWMREVEGQEISDQQWNQFKALAGVRRKKTRAAIVGGQKALF